MGQKKNIMIVLFIMLLPGLIFISPGILFCEDESRVEALIKEYEKKIAYDPYNGEIKQELSVLYHNRAKELADDGLWEEAIDKEERSYDLAPDTEVIKKTLAVYYNSYALELRDAGNFSKAAQCLKLAVDSFPDEPILKKNAAALYLVWADNLIRKDEYDNAERMLVNAERFDEENPYLYVMRGEIAYTRDNYYRAKENWSKALEFNPSLYNVRIKLEKLEKDQETERNFSIKELEHFKLKFKGIDKQDLAEEVAEILRNAYREVGQDYNLYPRATVLVVIYPRNKLKKLDYFPDWAAGTYDGKIRFRENLIENKTYMKAVLYHEYTHVLVRILGGDKVPLWLNEGLAEYSAKKFKTPEMRKARKMLLIKFFKNKTFFSIDRLGGMDLNRLSSLSPNRIELVYAQSESFINYLINRSSLHDMKTLLEHLKKGDSIYKAVKDVLFVDLDVLERDWKSGFGY
ncbi:MAG: hypothetical protein KAS13_09350 [Candidatus Omnitrophica bacterium]|nr:hypothetical protein [Candidatus Omnitrophota bacterium]